MPPLYVPPPPIGRRPPLVLPRGHDVREYLTGDDSSWPDYLAFPVDAGLLDPLCAYWHGNNSANDSGSPHGAP